MDHNSNNVILIARVAFFSSDHKDKDMNTWMVNYASKMIEEVFVFEKVFEQSIYSRDPTEKSLQGLLANFLNKLC